MNLELSSSIVYPALCLLPLLVYIRYARNSRLPPSPPSVPIIGHALLVPLTTPWKTFASWKETFGDVIYLHFYGSPKIVLNSLSAARDLLDKRSANFSGRPRQVVAGEMLGWNTSLPFLDYGERFKRQRRLMQRYFDAQSVKAFSGIQERGVQSYLGELLRNPEDFRGAAQRLVVGVVLRATYGYTIRSENDPIIDILHHATTEAAEIFYHGAITIEMLPILCYVPLWLPNWFPGVAGGRFAVKARANIDKAITIPFEELKSQKAAGVAEPCFISKLLDDYEEEQRDNPELQEDIKMLGAIAYTAGFESTWATILTFFLMMTLNRGVLKTAQDEIDSVVGSDRLPTMNNRPNLPYIDCIVKEVFRINPIFAQGLDHKATESDRYRDWVIPKGTLISPNIWQMMRDEEYFPNPQSFSPDRYLENVEGRPKPTGINADPSNFVFGFGRRICPGRFFAEGTIWLTIASTLAVFDIKPVTDPITGNESLPVADYSEAPPISFPKPFKCSITPRSEKHAQLIRDGFIN